MNLLELITKLDKLPKNGSTVEKVAEILAQTDLNPALTSAIINSIDQHGDFKSVISEFPDINIENPTPSTYNKDFGLDVMDILDSNSGGIKFTALIPELAHSKRAPNSEEGGWLKVFNVDELLDEIRLIPNVHILEYDWDMGQSHETEPQIRTKTFIYTKYK